MKKEIDIEKLVRWAVLEELPKGRSQSASAWDLISLYGSLGVRVDSSKRSDYLEFLPGEPDPDAVKVAAAIRTLPTAYRLPLETFYDLVSIGFAETDAPNLRALAAAAFNLSELIARRGALGRPDWNVRCADSNEVLQTRPTRVTYQSMNGGRPHPIVFGLDKDGDLIELRAPYPLDRTPRCHLNWDPSAGVIAETRAEYAAWHSGLCFLREQLEDSLDLYVPRGPAAPEKPWIAGETELSRVLDDLRSRKIA